MEIEFVFKKRQGGTEIFVKWPYAREIPQDNENSTEFHKQEEERKQKTERLIEKFRNRIGAAEIPPSYTSSFTSAGSLDINPESKVSIFLDRSY